MNKKLSTGVIIMTTASILSPLSAMALTTSREHPPVISDSAYMFPAFSNGDVLLNKKQGRLPAMGWNSWNPFGSANTEETTKAMADAFIDLGLDELGYEYIVLDDGCYKSTRDADGKLSNNEEKFPSGFKALADYIHDKGLKFGMYNDIGTNLCAGAAVGTAGYEDIDARTYKEWGVDFLKVDNCYYLWDNATFSDGRNAKYVYTPRIRSITVNGTDFSQTLNAVSDGELLGSGGSKNTGENYVNWLGTKDGTNTGVSPVGDMWSELAFTVTAPADGEYDLVVNYASGEENGSGNWLQVAVGDMDNETRYYDDMMPNSGGTSSYIDSEAIKINLKAGENTLRLMNHRRQENTLQSYAALVDGLNKYDPNHDTLLSICEWGKTQPQNWGYKVGNSWRILNDISFSVGVGGSANWDGNGTASIVSQYNKAVVMDEFAGLDKGWNDPDMLVIGMNGITTTMSKTHMTMWCMMNSPLMLGIDLRKVQKGDDNWNIIANTDAIALNQDPLGIQAKRIYSSAIPNNPDTSYTEITDRVDILAKPLANGDVALSFINIKQTDDSKTYSVDVDKIMSFIGNKMADKEKFENAEGYVVKDIWSKETTLNTDGVFSVSGLAACDNVTIRISPLSDDSDYTYLANISGDTNVHFNATNLNSTKQTVNFYAATYNQDGTLKDVFTGSKELAPLETVNVDSDLDFGDEETTVKAFMWDSQNTPLTESKTFVFNEQPGWSVTRKNIMNYSVDSENSVTIKTQTGDLWGTADGRGSAENLFLIPVSENTRDEFTAEVTVKYKPTADYQRAALIAYDGDGNHVTVMRRYHSAYGGNVFMTTMNTDGKAGSENVYTADSGSAECKLRLTKSGDVFKGYFSIDDGKTCNELETRTQANLNSTDTLQIGFYASNGDYDASSDAVTFENFTINGVLMDFEDVQ